MSRSNLSILGLYKWNSSLFADFDVPTGMDKTTAVNNILLSCAELELVYPDYDFMKEAIGLWSDTNQKNWEKLYATTVLDYNPIWNKDGTITESEVIGKDMNSSGTTTTNGTSVNQSEASSTDTNKVAAYNSSSYENREQRSLDDDSKTVSTAGSQGSYADTAKNNEVRQYQRKEQGNIGVTTTQSMIEEEREVDLFNLYKVIADDFKMKFCLCVY